jgi:hypothetical protein
LSTGFFIAEKEPEEKLGDLGLKERGQAVLPRITPKTGGATLLNGGCDPNWKNNI